MCQAAFFSRDADEKMRAAIDLWDSCGADHFSDAATARRAAEETPSCL